MIPDPILKDKIDHWRARQAGNGEPMTIEDWKQVFVDLRQARSTAQSASAASKSKRAGGGGKRAPKPQVSVADLKAGLKALAKPPQA